MAVVGNNIVPDEPVNKEVGIDAKIAMRLLRSAVYDGEIDPETALISVIDYFANGQYGVLMTADRLVDILAEEY